MDKELIKKELHALIGEGQHLYYASIILYDKNYFANGDPEEENFASQAFEETKDPHDNYYAWYGKACRIMQILAPESLQDFQRFFTNYIQSWLMHPSHDNNYGFDKFESGFRTQRRILKATAKNVDHVLFNLESEFQYGLSKSEIDVAKELQKNKHLREAGVIAGLVIELHLKNVAKNRNIKLPKNPQMKHYNEKLKNEIDDATITKQIELCSIIRNKCAHAGGALPTDDEVNTIISIAEKIIATVN